MKSFQIESDLAETDPSEVTARVVIEASALVMRRFRSEIKRGQATSLSFTQMRALSYLQDSRGVSLSEVSEFLGLQAPTTSKTIDEMVQEGLVRRETASGDRRRVTLYVTKAGESALERAIEPARRRVAELFGPLDETDRETIRRAMELLLPLVKPCMRAGEGVEHE
jgi:DNA-binding MarR family transcriptional regulator